MATENRILDLSFPAAEDLSNDQYRFVILTSTGTVRRPDSMAEIAVGVLQNAPAVAGDAAVVRVAGVSKLHLGATLATGVLTAPEWISATDAGKGIANATTRYAAGLIIDGAAEDELGSVLLGSITVTV